MKIANLEAVLVGAVMGGLETAATIASAVISAILWVAIQALFWGTLIFATLGVLKILTAIF